MKFKYYLSLALLLCTILAKAQVGIGTTNPDATLDIRATNQAAPANTDGMLIPKIDAFPATNPTAAQHGMLVFLTPVSGANQPGFYYWHNPSTSWKAVGSALTNDWSILGNTATTPGTNFLGTTDDRDIVVKRNNIRSGFIGDPNISTGNMNTSLGANSLINPSATGTRNVAIGTNVMPSISTGNRNVAIGEQTMFSNTTGTENVAVGVGAMYSSAAGVCNVAIGRNALTNTNGLSGSQGSNNTAVGYVALRTNSIGSYNSTLGRESLYTNLSGNNNVGLGYQAGYSNSIGSNNVFLGNQAGYFETGNNKLYISNSNADAVNALVYGEFDTKIVRTNGQIQVNDPATTGYKLPTARGTNKQILETDGSGNVSWATPNNSLSIIRTTLSADQALGTGGWQKVNFAFTIFDTNAEFVTASNRFVAAKTGYYQINAGYHVKAIATTNQFSIGVRINNGFYQETGGLHVGNGIVSRTINCIVSLTAGDYVEIFAENTAAGAIIDGYSGKTYFEVRQIR